MARDWHRFTVKAERLLRSDDDRGAVLARTELEKHIQAAPPSSSCMDAELFDHFLALCRTWSRRVEPVERDRIGDVARDAARVLISLPTERAKAIARVAEQGGFRHIAGFSG